jgi:hypothetical protein
MKIFEIITEAPNRNDELIQKIIDLWQNGLRSYDEIAKKLNIPSRHVARYLHKYFFNRDDKKEQEIVDPVLIQKIKDLWNGGMSSATLIAHELNMDLDRVKNILHRHYSDRPNKRKQGSIPQEIMSKLIQMYKNGQSNPTIIKTLNLDVTPTGINIALKKLPNWEEIRAEHLANKPTRKQQVATTDIYKPGTPGDGKGGNRFHKGPGSRHTTGVNRPKYG